MTVDLGCYSGRHAGPRLFEDDESIVLCSRDLAWPMALEDGVVGPSSDSCQLKVRV